MLIAGIILTLFGIITVGFSVFDNGLADLALQRCQSTGALSAQDYGEQQTTLWYTMGTVIGIGMFGLGLAFFMSSGLSLNGFATSRHECSRYRVIPGV